MRKHIINLIGASALVLLAVGCQKELTIEMPVPAPKAEKALVGEPSITDSDTGEKLFSTIHNDGIIKLNVDLPTETSTFTVAEYDEEVYNNALSKLKGVEPYAQYTLLPQDKVTIEVKDGTSSKQKVVEVSIQKVEELPYDTYIIPIILTLDNGDTIVHFVKVPRRGVFAPLSEYNKKPLPPSAPNYKEPIKMVAYVETNDWDPRNIANFVLKDSKLPVFDIIVCFAANMNYDAANQRRILFFNSELQPIVNNPDIYIKPIRDKGIKLVMDILPNHQGVGYHNFQSYEEALDFAGQLKEWADKTGIDGWDIDEEYARYDKLPNLRYNGMSGLWFLRAVRETMPNTLITHYEYQSPFTYGLKDETGREAADYIDFGWTDYGWTNHSTIGIPDNRFGNRSIQASYGQLSRGRSTAEATLRENLQVLMIFNMQVTKDNHDDFANQLSEITQVFYGEDCVYSGQHYIGPKGK